MGNCCYFCTRKPEIDRELRAIIEALPRKSAAPQHSSSKLGSAFLRPLGSKRLKSSAVCAIFDMLIQLHLPDGGRVIFLCLVITRLCAYIY